MGETERPLKTAGSQWLRKKCHPCFKHLFSKWPRLGRTGWNSKRSTGLGIGRLCPSLSKQNRTSTESITSWCALQGPVGCSLLKYFCAGCPNLWSALSTALVLLPLETTSFCHLLATQQPKDSPPAHLGALGTLLPCQTSFRPDGSVSCLIWGAE